MRSNESSLPVPDIPNSPSPDECVPRRILHVTGTLRRGGIETWLYHALLQLPRNRYQCDICTYRSADGDYAEDLRQRGFAIHYVAQRKGTAGFFRFVREFRSLLREGRYDIVHCHTLLQGGILLFLTWLENIPVRIAHSHSTDRRTGNRVSQALNRIGMVVNRPLVRMFATQGIGCSAEAGAALFGDRRSKNRGYEILHCGIDLKRFDSPGASLRQELGIPPDAIVVGHVSNFSLAKNPLFLVDIAAAAMNQDSRVWLLLVGDGLLHAAVRQRCTDRGITARVILTGVRPDVADLMRSMNIFLMPSVHEGLPLVLVEAQAAGLPCLVSSEVSREAAIIEGAVRFFPLAATPEDWGKAALDLVKTHNSPKDPVEIIRKTDFDIIVSAQRLANLYDALSAAEDPAEPAVASGNRK